MQDNEVRIKNVRGFVGRSWSEKILQFNIIPRDTTIYLVSESSDDVSPIHIDKSINSLQDVAVG